MGDAHPDVLHLHEIALQRVVEPVLKLDEVGELETLNSAAAVVDSFDGYAHLRVLFSAKGPNDELGSLRGMAQFTAQI